MRYFSHCTEGSNNPYYKTMTQSRLINFEIIKEPWNKYQTADNSVLMIRTILTKVDRATVDGKPTFRVSTQQIIVTDVDPSLKGTPSTISHSLEDIKGSFEKEDMRYDTLSQEFNEYILDDGSKIKIYTNVTGISRSRLYDSSGNPIYSVDWSHQTEIRASQQYYGS